MVSPHFHIFAQFAVNGRPKRSSRGPDADQKLAHGKGQGHGESLLPLIEVAPEKWTS